MRRRNLLSTFVPHHLRRDVFTPAHPPRSGWAKRLWDWWIRHEGHPPDELCVNRPGRHQRDAGAAHYIIRVGVVSYLVWEPAETLQITPAEAVLWEGTLDYMLR